jgi:hypothetical protein
MARKQAFHMSDGTVIVGRILEESGESYVIRAVQMDGQRVNRLHTIEKANVCGYSWVYEKGKS